MTRPTMADVARAAGISTALVSIVMRGVPGASDATRARVVRIADELGYVPDERARKLRQSRSRVLGVAFELQQPFHGDLVERLYAAAALHGYDIALSAVAPSRDERPRWRRCCASGARRWCCSAAGSPTTGWPAWPCGCPRCWSPGARTRQASAWCGATTWSASAWPSTTSSGSGTGASRTSTGPTRRAAPTGAWVSPPPSPATGWAATPTSSPAASPRRRAPAP